MDYNLISKMAAMEHELKDLHGARQSPSLESIVIWSQLRQAIQDKLEDLDKLSLIKELLK